MRDKTPETPTQNPTIDAKTLGKLAIEKETLKDLTPDQSNEERVKGGVPHVYSRVQPGC